VLTAWRARRMFIVKGRREPLGPIRSPSMRGVAEEAPNAYKDVAAVVDAAQAAGLAQKVAELQPLVCIKG
jgi:tRNA-splicing ligase RtcB (3'-phosphate/5'-hydroxy nucleic acid ligase)